MSNKVFGSSPFWNEDPEVLALNIDWAKKLARLIFDHDCEPVLPHLFFPRFIEESQENRDKVFEWTRLEYFKNPSTRVLEVWMLEGTPSPGMLMEKQWAKEFGIPIRIIDKECCQ